MPTRFNFLRGHPNRQSLPLSQVQDLLHQVAVVDDDDDDDDDQLEASLNYGPDPGDPQTLEALRAFLERQTRRDEGGCTYVRSEEDDDVAARGIIDDIHTNVAEDLETTPTSSMQPLSYFWTHGVSHGLDLLCTALFHPGDVILLECPTYFLAAQIFVSRHLQLKALPMRRDGGGVDVEQLETWLVEGHLHPPPKGLYLIPTHQNPTGHTLSLQDRWHLIRLARKYKFWILADEVYHLLDWRPAHHVPRRPARMTVLGSQHTVRPNHYDDGNDETYNGNIYILDNPCISVSSFTKIYCPGLRLGWIEAAPAIVEALSQVGYIQSQGGCAPFLGHVMRVALVQGQCDVVLDDLLSTYRRRSKLLCDTLQAEPRIQIHQLPLGGYFVWVSFEDVDDTDALLTYCQEQGLTFLPGRRCGDFLQTGSKGNLSATETDALIWCQRSARLCFADMDESDLTAGAQWLMQCYQEFVDPNQRLNN